MSIRVSPISKGAAVMIIFLGVFLLVGGVASGVLEATIAGVAITILGVVLYRLLGVFTKKIRREIEEGA